MPQTKELDNLFYLHAPADQTGLIVYSQQLSKRLNYVCRFIFHQVLRVNYVLTSDLSEFERSNLYKINYSGKDLDKVFNVQPASLLFEKEISQVKPKKKNDGGLPYFYENKNGNLGHDLFASVFYFIARYEEWQDFTPDKHQRFEAENSILFSDQNHLKPLVDIWIQEFKLALEKFYPGLSFPARQIKVISTVDVDNLYAYQAKGLIRTAGATLKDLLKFDLKNLRQRMGVVFGSKKDPFDVYDELSAFCAEMDIPLIWFFLFRTGTTYDRTVDPKSQTGAFKTVFNKVKKQGAFVGLHPSYDSAHETGRMKSEIESINSTLDEKVSLSRQHFLRFNIRTTPQLLLQNGINADFTMGYASSPGFRAGTSFPFYYYDLKADEETGLLVVPFCAMDGAYTVYDHTSPEETLQSLLKLAAEVKKVGGYFITVFHERTFSDHLYKGFGPLYKILHQKLKQV